MVRCSVAAILLASALTAAGAPVRVTGGLIAGTPGRHPEVLVVKGIPFAAPPVGTLRWKPPQPVTPWQGVRQANGYSDDCEQTPYPAGSAYASAPRPMSEDCLYLNVWTVPGSGDKRPVMVWIHGGGLTRGAASLAAYDGESLARKGVVVVTINYRLGVFGFFAHPELSRESGRGASGNYGILDQVAALRWVHDNIAAFGGDPGRVTIFGESAGSWSVNCLTATPLARGLFHRAIGESGALFGNLTSLRDAEGAGEKVAKSLDAASLAALRAVPAEALLKAYGLENVRPAVDGWVLPQDVETIFEKGQQNDVPLIAGWNADETTALSPWPADAHAARFIAANRALFGDMMAEFLKLYPAATDDEARQSHYASFRDYIFGWQMYTWARAGARTGKSPAFLYYFSHRPSGPVGERLGAYHASEISFVFDNLERRQVPPTEAERQLAGQMSAYWVNFAKGADPNGGGLPEWPRYAQKDESLLEFGDAVSVRPIPQRKQMDFFDRFDKAKR